MHISNSHMNCTPFRYVFSRRSDPCGCRCSAPLCRELREAWEADMQNPATAATWLHARQVYFMFGEPFIFWGCIGGGLKDT